MIHFILVTKKKLKRVVDNKVKSNKAKTTLAAVGTETNRLNIAWLITVGIVLFLGIITILSTCILNQVSSFSNESKPIVPTANGTENKLNLISTIIEKRIEKAAVILENTSKLPDMRGPLLLGQFSPLSKGIPENADLNRRQIGQKILSKYPEEFVAFLLQMPNGSVYLLEPYARQQNLSTYDLSHRDYYKGVINTNHIFLSNVITSASSGRNQAQLAVPVFSQAGTGQNGTLVGILSAGLNFKTYNKILQSLNLTGQERVVLLDSNGTKIADSDAKQKSSLLKSTTRDVSFRKLQSFGNAIRGQTGAILETINGSNFKIEYKPVKAIQNNWVLLLFQNTGASYSSLSQTGNATINVPINETTLNSNSTNKSSTLNSTLPELLPPQSVNGSNVPKI